MRKILREPLTHFLLLGTAIFLAHRLVSDRARDNPGRIEVTQGQVASMMVGFSRIWQRPPTREELDGLIQDHVREEVYYREALTMGLDRDDTIIRRRLRQKLEFITDDIATPAEPTDAELTEYLKTHSNVFRLERRLTFNQVYLNPDKHGERLTHNVAQLLMQLQHKGPGADLSALGDAFLLERRFEAAPGSEIAKQFGEKFAERIGDIPIGQWHGPVESGYGVHLVFVQKRTEGRVPELTEVRDTVLREWANARRKEANERFYQNLLKRYVVTIENPEPVAEQKKLAQVK